MAKPRRVRSIHTTTNVTVTAATETELCQLDGVTLRHPDERVVLRGHAEIVTGTGTAFVTYRIRRGTDTSGTQVGESQIDEANAGEYSLAPVEAEDTPGEVAGQSYVLTAQQSSATADGTCESCALTAEVGT